MKSTGFDPQLELLKAGCPWVNSITLLCLFITGENGNSNSSHFIGVIENSQ